MFNRGLWTGLVAFTLAAASSWAQAPFAEGIATEEGLTPAPVAAMPVESLPLGPGDLVYIDVYRRPELSSTTQVGLEGMVSLPYVGSVHIGGLTEAQASSKVAEALLRVLKNPRVTVSRSAVGATTGFRSESMKTELVPLQNADAETISGTLQNMTSPGGAVSFDPDTNTIVITDSPEALRNMMSVVQRLDQMQNQLSQVQIDAKIAEVRAGALKELGVRWFVQGNEVNAGYYPFPTQGPELNAYRGRSASPLVNEVFTSTDNNNTLADVGRRFVDPNFDRRLNIPVQIPRVGQFFFGLLNEHIDLGIMLDALVADDKAELLANPSILTINHQPAEIESLEQFPITEFATEVSGRSTTQTRFIELGIKLLVEPHVYNDADGMYVKLHLRPEVSYPSGSNNGVPIRSVRSSDTTARVKNGQTLVIGGIYRNDFKNIEQRVPGLGKVPVVGALFRHKERTQFQTELMVFVTPRVHETPESVTWNQVLHLTADSKMAPLLPLNAAMEQRKE